MRGRCWRGPLALVLLVLAACELPESAFAPTAEHAADGVIACTDCVITEDARALTGYLVQTVQRPAGDVPLVAGREAMLRVFVTGLGGPWPDSVSARVLLSGATRRLTLRRGRPTTSTSPGYGRACSGPGIAVSDSLDHVPPTLPDSVLECDLWSSYNAVVPKELVQPNMRVDVGVPGTTVRRRLLPDVRETVPKTFIVVPVFRHDSVPGADSSNARLRPRYDELRRTGLADPWFASALESLPLNRDLLTVEFHEGITFDGVDNLNFLPLSESHSAVVYGLWDRADADGNTWFYFVYDRMGDEICFGCAWGVSGTSPLTAKFFATGAPRRRRRTLHHDVLTHEWGHMMLLNHAPCGTARNPDPDFPHEDGKLGAWGWTHQFRHVVRRDGSDVMGYCRVNMYFWETDDGFTSIYGPDPSVAVRDVHRVHLLSDYHWEKAMRFMTDPAPLRSPAAAGAPIP